MGGEPVIADESEQDQVIETIEKPPEMDALVIIECRAGDTDCHISTTGQRDGHRKMEGKGSQSGE